MDSQEERDSNADLGDYDYAETSSDSIESLSSSSEEDNEDEQESGGSQEANKLQLQKRARKGRFLTNKKSKKAKKDQAKTDLKSLPEELSTHCNTGN